MKKNILLTSLTTLILLACIVFISDGLTFFVVSIMTLAVLAGIKYNKKKVLKITRWAKANPKKAQVFITIIQLILLIIAINTGYNLKELGYEFSNLTAYIFLGIMIIGFAAVPFLPKRSTIAIQNKVDKNRFAYLSIALSSVILMAITGNRIGDFYPNSPISTALERIDQTLFPEDINSTIEFDESQIGQLQSENYKSYLATSSARPLLAAVDVRPTEEVKKLSRSHSEVIKDSRKSKREIRKANRKARKELRIFKRQNRKNMRRAAAGGSCAAAVFLIILLVITSCAGICLTIFGVAAIGSGELIGIIGLALGPLILLGSIRGIRKVRKWCGKD